MVQVKIVTPQGFYGTFDVSKIHCTTVSGECTILPNHMPLVAMLKISKLSLMIQEVQHDFAIAGGILNFNNNKAEILVDSIEGKEEIDIDRAKASAERAQKRLDRKDANTSIRRAEVSLARAINRIHVKSN